MEMIVTMDEDQRPFRGNEIFSLTGKRVWVAGHRGMVGSALVRRLREEACEVLTVTRQAVDLRRQVEVEGWMRTSRPDVVLIAAATVGGIHANRTRPAEFIYDNLAIALNIVHTACEIGVEKLLFLGSSCIYPKYCAQPMTEDQLLSGPLEPTNQWYAIAKLAGLMMGKAYRAQHGMDCIAALPTNLYGPGDNFDLQQGHVVAALLRKLHEAKLNGDGAVEIWGTGRPKREFLHVDDLVDASIRLVTHYSGDEPVNIGSGQEVSIAELADLAARVVGYRGRLAYDTSMPDGPPRKLLDVTRMTELGWQPRIPLFEGLQHAYACYRKRLPPIAETDIAV
jgi:GDP-L-fucose synthase